MERRVLVPIADGIEEIEFAIVVDVLRRAGAHVDVASIGKLQIVCSRQVKVVADKLLSDCKTNTYDLIVIVGGMPGAKYLGEDALVIQMLKEQEQSGRFLAAMCAAPVVAFKKNDIVKGYKMTAYPSMIDELDNGVYDQVAVDRNCITSQGPGTTFAFALTLVKLLFNADTAKQLAEGLLTKY